MPYKRRSKDGETLKVRKAGEPAAALAFRSQNLTVHKFADTRRCPVCGFIIPKADDQPDFIVTSDWFYLEVKETNSEGYLRLPDMVTEVQRRRMALHEAYFFIIFRKEPDAPSPSGVSAFLVPYADWLEFEKYFEALGVKSIRKEPTKKLPGADDILKEYRLDWIGGHGNVAGRWGIPKSFRVKQDGQ